MNLKLKSWVLTMNHILQLLLTTFSLAVVLFESIYWLGVALLSESHCQIPYITQAGQIFTISSEDTLSPVGHQSFAVAFADWNFAEMALSSVKSSNECIIKKLISPFYNPSRTHGCPFRHWLDMWVCGVLDWGDVPIWLIHLSPFEQP